MTTLQDVLAYIEEHKEDEWEGNLRQIHLAIQKVKWTQDDAKKKGLVKTTPVATLVVKPKIAEEAMIMAKFMGQQVKARYPWYEPRIEEWALDIEKIHRIDKFDWVTIKTVCQFSQRDEFWCQQARSGKNLRKHFNKMLIATKAHYDKEDKNKVVKI